LLIVQLKSFGQLLRDADKQNQYDSENCPCGNKTERSLQSAPPVFAVGTVACSMHNFFMLRREEGNTKQETIQD
jgi:hypothetical protein